LMKWSCKGRGNFDPGWGVHELDHHRLRILLRIVASLDQNNKLICRTITAGST